MFDLHEAVKHQRHQDFIDVFHDRGGQRQTPCSHREDK